MSESNQVEEFRLRLARKVDGAVERESHFMAASQEVTTRAKEILILRMLTRFPTQNAMAEVEAIEPFLVLCARRQLVRELRREANAPLIELADDLDRRALAPASDDPQVQAQERHECAHLLVKIRLGLEELTAQQRQILELRLKGYRYKTIAAILGTTSNTVFVQGSQGMRKLRRLYREPK